MSDYRPIPCEFYSQLELWIMHRTALRVHWREGGQDHVGMLLPTDLRTEASKEEFLFANHLDGRPTKLRLDRIVSAEPLQEEELS